MNRPKFLFFPATLICANHFLWLLHHDTPRRPEEFVLLKSADQKTS